MQYYSILDSNVKRGLIRFSERISRGLTRPAFKFVTQMLYGMLSGQSCHLSKIGRALKEKSTLKKTIDRLSRNLSSFGQGAALMDHYVEKVKGVISDKTILIIDGSDITKPCSPKMEHIYQVRDGSTGAIAQGYATLGVTALTPERKMPIGVYTRVYSAAEPDYVSEETEVLKALDFLTRHFKKRNIRVMDRGYDARLYYERLIDQGEAFVIRAKKNRDVLYKGKRVNILSLANRFKGKYSLSYRKKNGFAADCKVSIVPVCLPCRPDVALNLVICHGIGRIPLLLLTNVKSDDARLPVVITKVYLLRWRIEEFYGFKKQQFGFEDFRVRSLGSIRNLDLLVTIAIGWLGMVSEKGDHSRMVMELIHLSRRIYDTPNFVFYAVADGLFTLAARACTGVAEMIRIKPVSLQLSFWKTPGFSCDCF